MPRLPDDPASDAGLDLEQQEFLRALGLASEAADWSDGLSVQTIYKQVVAETQIEARKGANAVYDLLLESRFSVPPGWLMSSMERDPVLARLAKV